MSARPNSPRPPEPIAVVKLSDRADVVALERNGKLCVGTRGQISGLQVPCQAPGEYLASTVVGSVVNTLPDQSINQSPMTIGIGGWAPAAAVRVVAYRKDGSELAATVVPVPGQPIVLWSLGTPTDAGSIRRVVAFDATGAELGHFPQAS